MSVAEQHADEPSRRGEGMMRADAFANCETAAYYLKELHNRPHTDRKMRVVFLVQDSVIWDKQKPVYVVVN